MQGKTISRFPPLLVSVWTLHALIILIPAYRPERVAVSSLSRRLPVLDENYARLNWREDFSPGDVQAKSVSVVFAAHGEHAYLVRTIQSVYDETPAEALAEIILVDDASTPPLAGIVAEKFPGVRILRHEIQQGLIRSKTHGAAVAVGDVVMFLDAHIKAEPGWLPPILLEISENYKRVVVPVIPILDEETWSWKPGTGVGIKMMFDWSLQFDWFEDGKDTVPVMSGGLLAIHRLWWFESGQYDTGMILYGAENIEQSIRIWLCGGEIKVARNSRVSHLFRPHFPYAINDTQVMINKVRLVEVWFDEFKEKVYEASPHLRRLIPYTGDLAPRFELRKNLQCGNFKDYVERFQDVFILRGLLPTSKFRIKEEASGFCLRSDGDRIIADTCAGNENFYFWIEGKQLRQEGMCFDANAQISEKMGLEILLFACHDAKNKNQQWKFKTPEIKWQELCAFFGDDKILRLGACGTQNFVIDND